MKFVLYTKETLPREPPTLAISSFEPLEHGVTSEAELVQYIFRREGSGSYLVQAPIGHRSRFKPLWEGEIQVEDDQNLLFKASRNKLVEHTTLAVTPPLVDELKRVEIPADLRDQVYEELRVQERQQDPST